MQTLTIIPALDFVALFIYLKVTIEDIRFRKINVIPVYLVSIIALVFHFFNHSLFQALVAGALLYTIGFVLWYFLRFGGGDVDMLGLIGFIYPFHSALILKILSILILGLTIYIIVKKPKGTIPFVGVYFVALMLFWLIR